jgi:hypothetical protein
LTTSNSLTGLSSAGGWFKIIQFHYGLYFLEEAIRGRGRRCKIRQLSYQQGKFVS